ncbi:MAG: hypothetical protein Q9162_004488 [Coniocarpon cinnabarinum]
MKVASAFVVLASVAAVWSTSVLLPLYVYPDPGKWDPVYNAISGSSATKFVVVINPSSGPGGDTPADHYADAVTKLKGYENVLTIGYVRTNYTNIPLDQTTQDISSYAAWPTSAQPSGIFFDEVTADTDSAATSYMSSAAAAAHSAFPSSTVVFNPGAVEDSTYFDYADLIVGYEDFWSKYDPSNTPSTLGNAAKSAIIVKEVPAGADIGVAIATAKADGIGAVYFSSDSDYQVLSLLEQVAEGVGSSD